MAEKTRAEDRAADRLARIRAARGKPHPTTWPGTDIPLLMVVLTDEGHVDAKAAAHAEMREKKIPDGKINTNETFDNILRRHILYFVCRDPEDVTERFFASIDEMRAETTLMQQHLAFVEYSGFEADAHPQEHQLTEEDRLTIYDLVKKKAAADLLALGARTLSSYLTTTADPPPPSTTGK